MHTSYKLAAAGGFCIFTKYAKFFIWLYLKRKLNIKIKNSARAKSEKLVSFYTLRFIHKTVTQHLTKLKVKLKNINWTKNRGILIIGICLGAMLLKFLVWPYRGTWIYQYGNMISILIFYGGVFWSFINTIILLSKHKSDLKNNLIWIILTAIPFLYIGIMMVIAMTKTID